MLRTAVKAARRSMSTAAPVWIDENTRVVCQGMTGKHVRCTAKPQGRAERASPRRAIATPFLHREKLPRWDRARQRRLAWRRALLLFSLLSCEKGPSSPSLPLPSPSLVTALFFSPQRKPPRRAPRRFSFAPRLRRRRGRCRCGSFRFGLVSGHLPHGEGDRVRHQDGRRRAPRQGRPGAPGPAHLCVRRGVHEGMSDAPSAPFVLSFCCAWQRALTRAHLVLLPLLHRPAPTRASSTCRRPPPRAPSLRASRPRCRSLLPSPRASRSPTWSRSSGT